MIFWIGVVFLAGCAGMGAIGRRGWPFELFASVAPQQAMTCALFAALAVSFGQMLAAAFAVLVLGLNLWTAREILAPRAPALPRRTLRIVWANVWGKPQAFVRVFALAEREGADMVAIGEMARITDEDRRAITQLFPHCAGGVADNAINVSLFSRLPLAAIEPIAIAALPERASLAVRVETPSGALRVIAIHPLVPYTTAMNANRDAMLSAAFAQGSDAPAAVIVGDFNTTSWSSHLRGLIRSAKAQHAAWGAGATWVSPLPVLGLPIDHAIGFGAARVAARTGPFTGSDHYPIIVDVKLDV